MLDTIHIVSEANVVEQTDLIAPTTVWACRGDSDNYAESGTKVAGPIPAYFADQVVTGLSSLLQSLGFQVVIEQTADD
jgi:hypothetical protein